MSLRLRLCVVGRLKNGGLQQLCDDYEKRIRRHCSFEQLEAKDDEQLRRLIRDEDYNVALQVGGGAYTSREFAARLERWGQQRGGRISLFIGAANGIPDDVGARCQAALSLSPMTLPHRIARLLLCEQLYRATTLWRGEPYARED